MIEVADVNFLLYTTPRQWCVIRCWKQCNRSFDRSMNFPFLRSKRHQKPHLISIHFISAGCIVQQAFRQSSMHSELNGTFHGLWSLWNVNYDLSQLNVFCGLFDWKFKRFTYADLLGVRHPFGGSGRWIKCMKLAVYFEWIEARPDTRRQLQVRFYVSQETYSFRVRNFQSSDC